MALVHFIYKMWFINLIIWYMEMFDGNVHLLWMNFVYKGKSFRHSANQRRRFSGKSSDDDDDRLSAKLHWAESQDAITQVYLLNKNSDLYKFYFSQQRHPKCKSRVEGSKFCRMSEVTSIFFKKFSRSKSEINMEQKFCLQP